MPPIRLHSWHVKTLIIVLKVGVSKMEIVGFINHFLTFSRYSGIMLVIRSLTKQQKGIKNE